MVFIYNNLEWAFNSPPKPSAFVSLPLESKISLTSFIKHLTLANIITGLVIFIVFFLLRNFVFIELYYPIIVTLLENIYFELHINKDLLLGIWAVISRFSLKGFIEDFLEVFSSQKLVIGNENLPLFMNQDPISEGKKGLKQSVGLVNNQVSEQKIMDLTFTDLIRVEFDKFKTDMAKYSKSLHDRQHMFDRGTLSMNHSEVPGLLVMMLQDQTQFFNASILTRMEWTKVTQPILPSEVKVKMSSYAENIYKLQNDYTRNIDKIRQIEDNKQQVKEFFDLLNAYRNNVRKEIIKLETASRDGFRAFLPDLYKLKEFKQLVNVDAPKIIKEVVDQDAYLKTKLSEIINAKKN